LEEGMKEEDGIRKSLTACREKYFTPILDKPPDLSRNPTPQSILQCNIPLKNDLQTPDPLGVKLRCAFFLFFILFEGLSPFLSTSLPTSPRKEKIWEAQ
jgi:hypothetical protein